MARKRVGEWRSEAGKMRCARVKGPKAWSDPTADMALEEDFREELDDCLTRWAIEEARKEGLI